MAINHFTSTATRHGRWWVVQCDQHPGALSQVSRLDQAAEHQREAISMVTDLDEADIEVEVVPVTNLDDKILAAREAKVAAERASETYAVVVREAAKALSEQGATVRDIGVLLGVSPQRVSQLTH